MESVSDVLNSVKATLYERISNPLLSTFIVSWVIWNYKFMLVIFSSSIDVIEKIDYIKFDLLPFTYSPFFTYSNLCTVLYLFIGPIVTSLLYLYVIYPRIGKAVYKDHSDHIKEYQDIKVTIDGKTSMSDEDVRALKSKLRTIEGIHSKQLDLKEDKIQLLKNDLDNATQDAANSRSQLSSIQGQKAKLDDFQEQLLKLTEKNKFKEDKIQKLEEINKELTTKIKSVENISSEAKVIKKALKAGPAIRKKLSDEAANLLKIISYDTSWQSINGLRGKYTIHRLRFDEAINKLSDEKYITNKSGQVIITPEGEKYLLEYNIV